MLVVLWEGIEGEGHEVKNTTDYSLCQRLFEAMGQNGVQLRKSRFETVRDAEFG
jgi:hypothetical protein